MAVDIRLGVALDNDEHVVRIVALTDKLIASRKMLEARGWVDLGLFDPRQCVG